MRKKLGSWGEDMAADYLTKQGYKIMDRNYHTRYGELDIVCEKNTSLVFVEVKTRRNTRYGFPEESVTPKKIEHLKKAALLYLESRQRPFREISFDVVAILLEEGKYKINHIKNAF